MTEESAKAKLVDEISSFALDPLGYAYYAFPWGQPGQLEKERLRKWQIEALAEIRDHLSDPAKRHQPCRIARASGHGIGKSAEISIIAAWALDTMPNSRVVITANTEQQLTTKTSPEVTKWRKLAITCDWYDVSTMSHKHKENPDGWRLDFVTWSKTNTEAFAGLHNKGSRIVLIMDEGSGIDDLVYQVAEGALTDEDTEIIWIVFGNPTKNTGRFREMFGKHRHLWNSKQIDSRTVEGTNKVHLQSIVDTYGIDSDITKVRVLGQFPSASSMQFIGSKLAEDAQERELAQGAILSSDPVIFGVDHARFGDDTSVMAIRQGRDARSRPWLKWPGTGNSQTIAGDINSAMKQHLPDAVFIDAGGPNAGGIIDRLRALNPDYDAIFEIHFGSQSEGMTARFNNEQRVRVANKRAQMWQNMKTWLERGVIPDEQQLKDDLIGPEYSYAGTAEQVIQLEKKQHMKARGLASPDWADALALTFAEEVAPRTIPEYLNPTNYGIKTEYDRYRDLPGYQAHEQGGGDYDRDSI